MNSDKLIDKLKVEELIDDSEDYLQSARHFAIEREMISEHILPLELLAHAQFATAGQLIRVLRSGDNAERCRLIEILINEKLIGKIGNISVLRGRYEGAKTTVYFLTPKGKKSLKFFFPKTARYAKTGFPNRISHSRINHQLLAAEAYLDFDKTFKIFKCENEDLLRADFEIENAQRKKRGLDPLKSQGGYPDLRIAYLHNDTKIGVSSVEACLKLSLSQIKGKPRNYDWFVYDRGTQSRVWVIKEEYATIADDILAPVDVEQHFRTKSKPKKITEAEIKTGIISFLKSIGGGATKNLILKITKLKETKLRHELDKMVAEKSLLKTETCLISGTSRGRNVNFFYFPQNLEEPNFLQKQIVCSYAIEIINSKGYTPCYVDLLGVVVFHSLDDPERGALLLTDFATSLITGKEVSIWKKHNIADYELYAEHEKDTLRRQNNKYFYASTDLRGISAVKEMNLPDLEIIDLSAIKQAQSYRFKVELGSDTITRDNRRRID